MLDCSEPSAAVLLTEKKKQKKLHTGEKNKKK